MKRLAVFLCIAVIPMTAVVSSAIDLGFQTGFNFDWWGDSKDNSAYQIFTPFRMDGRVQDFSFALLSGYAFTHANPSFGQDQSLSHVLDTKLNFSYQIVDKLPVDVMLGLDFNLPTGKTNFKERQTILIMDPDLISINTFGEGFNLNPTLTIAKQVGPFAFGVGAGYTWRGEYNFTTELQDYNPGDILTVTGEARYHFSGNWRARIFSQYASFTKDKLHEGDFYKEGDFLMFGGGVDYSQPKWVSGFLFRAIFRDKSKFQVAPGELATEEHNFHGDEYRGDLYFRYLLNDRTTVKSYLQGLFITRNGYSSDFPAFIGEVNRFIGQRKKVALGLGASRVIMPHLEGEFYVKGFLMHDDKAFFPDIRGSRTYQGVSVGVQLAGRF